MKRLVFFFGGLILLSCSSSLAQDRCVAFTGTINAGLVLDPLSTPQVRWLGVASFNIDTGLATTMTINTGLKRGNPADPSTLPWIGNEETTVSFDSGTGGFLLLTRFVAPAAPEGMVNETGNIAPVPGSTGKYADVHGRFTLHGPAGPVAPGSPLLPPGYPFGYIPLWMGWMGEYHGNICGIND